MNQSFATIDERRHARLFACAALCVVWAVYASVVGLAFLHDDAPVIASIYSSTIFDVFIPVGTHYRPSSYVLWLLVRDAFGYFDSVPIYWISLALHALNMGLVMRLSAVLRRRRFAALENSDVWAGLLFGLFPLSYQALTWSSAMVHPTLCAYTLVAALLAARLSTHNHSIVVRSALALGMISACALACTSHQLGIIAPLLVGLTVAFVSNAPWPRRLAALAIGAAAGLAYGVWLRSFPGIAPATQITLSAVQQLLLSDALPLLAQAAAFPMLPVLLALGYVEPVIETRAALLMSAIGAGLLTLLIALLTGRLRAWIFALAWIMITALPLLLALPDNYVRLGPRLFYTTAVGICLAWSMAMSSRGRVARVISSVVALLVCAWSAAFAGERVEIASQVSQAIKSIGAGMRQALDNQRVLIVNHPIWAAVAANALPMGSSAVLIFADEYSPPWQLYWANARVQRDVRLLRPIDALGMSIDSGHARYELTGARLGAAERKALLTPPVSIYEFVTEAGVVSARSHGGLNLDTPTDGIAEPSEPPLAHFDLEPGVANLISAHAFACDQLIRLDLQWARVAGVVSAVGVSVHVNAGGDDVLAAADADLLGNMLPLNELKPGERVNESRYLENPRARSDAQKSIRLGVYYKSTGQPKRAWRADGAEWERNEVVIPVEIDGAQCR